METIELFFVNLLYTIGFLMGIIVGICFDRIMQRRGRIESLKREIAKIRNVIDKKLNEKEKGGQIKNGRK